MTAKEKRELIVAQAKPAIGRNGYSQNAVKRECVFTPYKNGKYYSDCSSFVRHLYRKAGLIGHGSGTPRTIEMTRYCRSRQAARTSTARGNRGLIKVVRFIADDMEYAPPPLRVAAVETAVDRQQQIIDTMLGNH